MTRRGLSHSPSITGNRNDIEWNRDNDWRGIMSEEVPRTLQERDCLDMSGAPSCDLQNGIHPIFVAENFISLSGQEYIFLRPALTLATRFIIDDEYQDFWLHILYGHTVPRTRQKRLEEYVVSDFAQDDLSHRWNGLEAIFATLSERIKFFVKDVAWSEVDREEGTVGETFPDLEDMSCKPSGSVTGVR